MRVLRCGCTVPDQYSFASRCPKCNKFLYNLFLSEPFPRGYDSPMRELLGKIYHLNCVAQKAQFRAIKSNQKLRGIESAIYNSEICLFDLTGEIFNVGYEFGLALAHFLTPEKRKYIIVGASGRLSSFVLSNQMIINKILKNNDKQLARRVNQYIIKQDYNQLNSKNAIEGCDKTIREITTIYYDENMEINKLNEDFYPKIEFPFKKFGKEILVLTPKKFQHYFDNVDFPSNHEPHFMNINAIFQGSSDMPTLLKNICNNVVGKYDYIIVHLLSDKHDHIKSSRKINFQAGIISGMMRGLKRDSQSDFYIKHKESKYPSLRCTDIPIFDKYVRYTDIGRIANEIIHTSINRN